MNHHSTSMKNHSKHDSRPSKLLRYLLVYNTQCKFEPMLVKGLFLCNKLLQKCFKLLENFKVLKNAYLVHNDSTFGTCNINTCICLIHIHSTIINVILLVIFFGFPHAKGKSDHMEIIGRLSLTTLCFYICKFNKCLTSFDHECTYLT